MRFITTFNDKYYRASGKQMLATLREFVPDADVLVYEELDEETITEPSVKVDELPEFHLVLENNRDVIPVDMGGDGTAELKGFNRRWFGWFRKILAEHDALTRNTYDGITILLDTDVRMVKPITDAWVEERLHRPVGVFQGDRPAVEAGVVVYDGRQQLAVDYITHLMGLFTSGEFRKIDRWDDGYMMTQAINNMPESAIDFAEGLYQVEHTNSNGHMTGGHVIPQTEWGAIFEHDKGMHSRSGVAPSLMLPAEDKPDESKSPASEPTTIWSQIKGMFGGSNK